jgi:hypothetical protein
LPPPRTLLFLFYGRCLTKKSARLQIEVDWDEIWPRNLSRHPPISSPQNHDDSCPILGGHRTRVRCRSAGGLI